ncbi:hypothetical protein COW64_12705 [bacterium (Candidatus Blackallbacteria) CG18_big_fil_WC_8_21_14_2_50_49_26]|nr:MAG: hypothetical protein COW64_12705 [bacterium (Candidatus Blackallbacteria) CG18_big_fil_WC_8_21_14_2_50_49_26]
MSNKSTPFLDAGQYLKRVRKQQGLSQIELAEKMAQLIQKELPGEEFSQSTISQLERGYIRLSKVKLRLLFQALGISPEERSQLSRLYLYESSPKQSSMGFHQQEYLQNLGRQALEKPSDFFIRANQISCYMQLGEMQMAIMHAQDALEKVRLTGAQKLIHYILQSKLLSAQSTQENSRTRQLEMLQKSCRTLEEGLQEWRRLEIQLKNKLPASQFQQLRLHLTLSHFTPLFQLFNHRYGRTPLASSLEEIQADFKQLGQVLQELRTALADLKQEEWFIDVKYLEREDLRVRYLYQEIWQSHFIFRYFRSVQVARSARRIRDIPQIMLKSKQKLKAMNNLRNLFGINAEGELTLQGADASQQEESEALQKYTRDLAMGIRSHFLSYQNLTQNAGLYSPDAQFNESFTSTYFLLPQLLARLGVFSDMNLETLYFLTNSTTQSNYHFLCANYFALRYISLCLQGNSEMRLEYLEKSALHFHKTSLSTERIFLEPYLWTAYLLAIFREDSPKEENNSFARIKEGLQKWGEESN